MLILADSGSGGTPATTRFAVNQIRALLAGGRAVADDAGWTSEAFLRFDAGPVPLYLGAMSPRMLALAGECADGVLPLLYPPEHYPTAAEQVLDGARAAGRDPDDIDLAACIWVSVDRDEARARRPLAEKIAYDGASFAPYRCTAQGCRPPTSNRFKLRCAPTGSTARSRWSPTGCSRSASPAHPSRSWPAARD